MANVRKKIDGRWYTAEHMFKRKGEAQKKVQASIDTWGAAYSWRILPGPKGSKWVIWKSVAKVK